jgi:hypothetical protein
VEGARGEGEDENTRKIVSCSDIPVMKEEKECEGNLYLANVLVLSWPSGRNMGKRGE